MQLDLMTWSEVEDYLSHSKGVLIATGSTEQHGPVGLIGTDVICANSIATEVANAIESIVLPPLGYTPAPFNTGFPGTLSLSPSVFKAMAAEIFAGLQDQGFTHVYVVNGHGANLEPLSEVVGSCPQMQIRVRSWWSYDEVQDIRDSLYGEWEGMHATPSEVAISQHVTGIVHEGGDIPPQKLTADYIREHSGDRHGPPDEHRRLFPDGRVGSHSALANATDGKRIFDAAVSAIAKDYSEFVQR